MNATLAIILLVTYVMGWINGYLSGRGQSC
jgi:hypothetical protein